ncbi:MAG: hypothetical protein A2991_01295 [Candidatus Terrybacteria bacterium RIFCSPLOWO2_01_FULL_58_14]|uniref:Uncharacterized protein n=2 Tax=Candidatus Terryibacteriota TaxID=1817920 RepID=A0A1G2PYQ4_9BACT|nr:MAG: hypothetical protein A2682_01685 [Candidatus Terrybacteria bacterium RIFCSPHIGHO2_01_FULL_58_15]OHA53457.1 MAG: hypothetical protein A2991_01295 [Candidatus Terrybacteria bacterium RIFCSPLOWO2_01_FULL_58_14]
MRSVLFGATLAALLFSATPFLATANGEWEKYLPEEPAILLGLSAAPSSPAIGERIGFLVAFRDPETKAYLANAPSEFRFEIEAFAVSAYPNGGIIHRSEPITVTEGSGEFPYIFSEPGTYDFHIVFADTAGRTRNAGFLLQVRETTPTRGNTAINPLTIISVFAVGLISGYALARRRRS